MLIHHAARTRRHHRIRAKISGTAERPRLVVSRSLRAVSAQLIDDQAGRTLVSAYQRELKSAAGAKTDKAVAVGKLLAEKAQAKQITQAVFDRAGYRYHGRVKALADSARQHGLKI